MSTKAVILIGGPNKGQRFRPLSFDSPKYSFPVGGQTIIGQLIESCLELENLSEIILLGFYQQDDKLSPIYLQSIVQNFLRTTKRDKRSPGSAIHVSYLQEFTRMGTAGGLYHFRDQIRHGNPENFLVINGDVCGNFDFKDMLTQHKQTCSNELRAGRPVPLVTVMTTEASRSDSLNYGCVVEDLLTHVITHYVEKPSTFVSNIINCGAYACSLEFLTILEGAMSKKRSEILSAPNFHEHLSSGFTRFDSHPDYLSLELNILQQDCWQSRCYSYRTQGLWWCQVKTAAAAIYANGQYLKRQCREGATHLDEYGQPRQCSIIGNVYIHPTAVVDASSVIGPNVSIMEKCVIGPGVRAKESIILENAIIDAHSLILCSIIGWNCNVGTWVRIEGTPSEPDPNQKFAKVQNPALFNSDGKLNPSITVLGCNVKIPDGTVILNTIVLPHKELSRSYKNEIVL